MRKCAVLFALAAISAAVSLFSYRCCRDALEKYLRQAQDEKAAEAYLRNAAEECGTETASAGAAPEEAGDAETTLAGTAGEPDTAARAALASAPSLFPEAEASSLYFEEITDTEIYGRTDWGGLMTDSDAVGAIDCVLEIPAIQLKRCVYGGTDEEISYNLDRWFLTKAWSALSLGSTHYAIYGHNSPYQSLSMNRLGSVEVGDYFTLTKDGTVYLYFVTGIYAAEREAAETTYVTADLPDEKCYIITCGRQTMLVDGRATSGCDYVVEGTLYRAMTAAVWQYGNPDPAGNRQTAESAPETEEADVREEGSPGETGPVSSEEADAAPKESAEQTSASERKGTFSLTAGMLTIGVMAGSGICAIAMATAAVLSIPARHSVGKSGRSRRKTR